jgi:hypothetical protein
LVANPLFNRQDIDDLARKLSSNQQLLTKRERQLLLAIFEAAGQNVQRPGPAEDPSVTDIPGNGELTAEELQQQLLRSFTPGTHGAEIRPLKIVGV